MASRQARGPAVSDFHPAQAATSVTAPWDPRPKIRGDGTRRAHPRSQCSNGREATRITSLSKPPKRQDGNPTYTNGCAAFPCTAPLCAAETLSFLHMKTRKPAVSLLRNNLWLC